MNNEDLTPKIRGEDALFAFASGTGGELLSDDNDLEAQIRRVADRTSLTYVLSFSPTRRLGEGRYHELKVRVKTDGARVSARAGYYESRLFRTLSPLERTLSAAALVTHETGGGSWPMDVLAVPAPAQPLGRAAIVLQIPGPALLAGGGQKIRLGVYVYAMTESGELADYFARSVTLDLGRERERLASGPFRYRGAMSLPPGPYRIRVLVRDEDRGVYAFRSIPATVPAGAAADFVLEPPIFLAAADQGLNLGDPTAAGDQETFRIGTEAFVPALVPSLQSGQPVRLCLLGWGAGADAAFEVQATVLSRTGISAPVRFTILGREPSSPAGPVKLLAEFAPGPLPAGDAVLRVTVRDPAGTRKTAASEARFRVEAAR